MVLVGTGIRTNQFNFDELDIGHFLTWVETLIYPNEMNVMGDFF